jgi:hypothetical protein
MGVFEKTEISHQENVFFQIVKIKIDDNSSFHPKI